MGLTPNPPNPQRVMQQAAAWSERRRPGSASAAGSHSERQRANYPLRAGGGIIRGAAAAPQQARASLGAIPAASSYWAHHPTPCTRVPGCCDPSSPSTAAFPPTFPPTMEAEECARRPHSGVPATSRSGLPQLSASWPLWQGSPPLDNHNTVGGVGGDNSIPTRYCAPVPWGSGGSSEGASSGMYYRALPDYGGPPLLYHVPPIT